MKYIIFDKNDLPLPVIFPKSFEHVNIAKQMGLPVLSAGFAKKDGNQWSCFGRSDSLNVESSPDDSTIFNAFLNL